MMKILSIFPGFVGAICILILLGSIIGFSHQEKINDIPIVPCSDDEDIGCRIGMTSSDINVPNAFKLLQIEVDVNWGEPDRSWFGVINKYPGACEPDSNGLTNCTEEDFEGLIIAGGSDSEGNLKFDMINVNSSRYSLCLILVYWWLMEKGNSIIRKRHIASTYKIK